MKRHALIASTEAYTVIKRCLENIREFCDMISRYRNCPLTLELDLMHAITHVQRIEGNREFDVKVRR